MTFERLKKYQAICAGIKELEEELKIYAPTVDTTKESINSGKISKQTENTAILLAMDETYEKLKKEQRAIVNFINSIPDKEIKSIAVMKFMRGLSYEEIGERVNYDRRTVSRKLHSYIN